MFKFKDGARVKLKQPNPTLGITSKMTGVIWALYDIVPPAYEVKFVDSEGKAFDGLFYEAELELAAGRAQKTRIGSKPMKFAGVAHDAKELTRRKASREK